MFIARFTKTLSGGIARLEPVGTPRQNRHVRRASPAYEPSTWRHPRIHAHIPSQHRACDGRYRRPGPNFCYLGAANRLGATRHSAISTLINQGPKAFPAQSGATPGRSGPNSDSVPAKWHCSSCGVAATHTPCSVEPHQGDTATCRVMRNARSNLQRLQLDTTPSISDGTRTYTSALAGFPKVLLKAHGGPFPRDREAAIGHFCACSPNFLTVALAW